MVPPGSSPVRLGMRTSVASLKRRLLVAIATTGLARGTVLSERGFYWAVSRTSWQ